MTGSGQDEQRRRLGALRAEELARLDAAASTAGLPLEVLMETAGWQVARAAWGMLGRRPGTVCVAAGRGNNGGDALVAARQLAGWGCSVEVLLLLGGSRPNPLVVEQRARLLAATSWAAHGSGIVRELHSTEQVAAAGAGAASARLVIDGLLGSGLRGAPRGLDAELITALRHPRILSVDVPSGLDVDEGSAAGACVRAAATCTLTAMKLGLWGASARILTGRLLVADIGMPEAAWRATGLTAPTAVRGGALLRVPAGVD